MKRLKTFILTYIKKLYNNNNMWVEVPTICKCRKDKDFIIMTTIEHLEQTIKIQKNE